MKQPQKVKRQLVPKVGRIICPCSCEGGSPLYQKLKPIGAEIVSVPVYKEKNFPKNIRLGQALSEIESYNWAVFASVHSVELFFHELRNRRIDIRQLNRLKFAALIPKVRDVIEQRGILVEYMPLSSGLEAMAKGLSKRVYQKERILIPGMEDSHLFCSVLDRQGYGYDLIPLWENEFTESDLPEISRLDVTVFSGFAVLQGFSVLLKKSDLIKDKKAVCLDEKTASQARKLGFSVSVASEASLTKTVEELLNTVSGGDA